MSHVNFVEHLVTLIQDEYLEIFKIECLLLDQGKDTSRSTDDDVWWLESFKNLLVLTDGDSTIEHLRANIFEVLSESVYFLLDLMG